MTFIVDSYALLRESRCRCQNEKLAFVPFHVQQKQFGSRLEKSQSHALKIVKPDHFGGFRFYLHKTLRLKPRDKAGVAEWLRRWAADPLYMGSIPIPGSNPCSTYKPACNISPQFKTTAREHSSLESCPSSGLRLSGY